jgi:ArsR family transcriptional regulator
MKECDAIGALAALAHETRLRAFRALVGAGPGGLSAGVLSLRLRLASPNLSFHLSHLSRAGLVSARRQGRSIIYTANFDAMNGLLRYLTDHCCGGRPELCVEQGGALASGATVGCRPERRAAGPRLKRLSS